MKYNCSKIQKFTSPKAFFDLCACTQGEAHLQTCLGSLLGCISACPPVIWVTVWVEARGAKCLWLAESTFTWEELWPIAFLRGSCKIFKWNPTVLKGQWWEVVSLVYSFPVHVSPGCRFFCVAWSVFPVLLAGVHHVELAPLHGVFLPSSIGGYRREHCWSNHHVDCPPVHWRLYHSDIFKNDCSNPGNKVVFAGTTYNKMG